MSPRQPVLGIHPIPSFTARRTPTGSYVRPTLQAVLLGGITIAGLGLVDPTALAAQLPRCSW